MTQSWLNTKRCKLFVFIFAWLVNASHTFAIDIIAHRGASGYLPENTKEAVVMAYMQGADYIEQDLVLSKDDKLVVLHDIYLEDTTNVEAVYPSRHREDGRYYVIDFTLAELRALSIHERKNKNAEQVYPTRYKGRAHFAITTFDEQAELIGELNRQLFKNTGLYPEIKAPQWHRSQGKDITLVFANKIKELGFNRTNQKMFIQSFDPTALKRLKNDLNIVVPLIQLMGENSWSISAADYTYLKSDDGLKHIASYASGIGPWIPQLIDTTLPSQVSKAVDKSVIQSGLVFRAKRQGLLVHPYTLRKDDSRLESVDAEDIYERLKSEGIDGIFTDQILPYMKTD